MNKSESIKNLATALSKAAEELKNPFNSAANPFFKSKYAPLDDTLNLVRPILQKNGLSLIQSPVNDGDKVGVAAILTHATGEYIEFEPFYLTLAKNDPQGAGGAVTYARRYQINAILGIVGDDDDDGNEISGNKPKSESILCADCKKQITCGDNKTALQISIGTEKMCKKKLCLDCFRKWQADQKAKISEVSNEEV